eukprot:1193293-Prorocentrum_minimum.AAC.3
MKDDRSRGEFRFNAKRESVADNWWSGGLNCRVEPYPGELMQPTAVNNAAPRRNNGATALKNWGGDFEFSSGRAA